MMKFEDYSIKIEPLSREDGGGYLVLLPDLPGLMADGETIDEAIKQAQDAFNAWRAAEIEDKGKLPKPKTYSGQFVQRLPKSLHAKLAKRAEIEGVSLNQLAATLLSRSVAEF